MDELERLRGMVADPLFNTLPRMEQSQIQTRIRVLENLARGRAAATFPGSSTYQPLGQRELEQRQAEERRRQEQAEGVRSRAGRMDVVPDYAERMQAGAAMPYPGLPSLAPEIPAPAPAPASTPDAASAPPPAPPAPNPMQQYIDRLLSPRGGGSPIPKAPRVDVEKIKGEIPKVGEREAQETYKADPYMTMLQTGLRILAAKPELGQSAISAIAGPVGEGVKEYRGEKEKERTSKREEAKEARADQYARAEAAKSTAALGLQATTLNTNIALKEMELAQQAAQHGETASLQRGRLALEAMKEQQEAVLRQAQADYYRSRDPQYIVNASRPLENRRAEIEARLRDPATPETEKSILNSEMGRIDRDLGTLRGTLRAETAAGAGLDRAQVQGLMRVYQAGIGNPLAQQDPEYRAAVAKLREMGLLPGVPDPNASLR